MSPPLSAVSLVSLALASWGFRRAITLSFPLVAAFSGLMVCQALKNPWGST